MTIEEEKQLLDEKKLVAKELMGWDTCMYRMWHPNDPEKAICNDWQDIFEQMKSKNIMNDYITKLFYDRDSSIETYEQAYVYIHTCSVDIRWKILIETLKKEEQPKFIV